MSDRKCWTSRTSPKKRYPPIMRTDHVENVWANRVVNRGEMSSQYKIPHGQYGNSPVGFARYHNSFHDDDDEDDTDLLASSTTTETTPQQNLPLQQQHRHNHIADLPNWGLSHIPAAAAVGAVVVLMLLYLLSSACTQEPQGIASSECWVSFKEQGCDMEDPLGSVCRNLYQCALSQSKDSRDAKPKETPEQDQLCYQNEGYTAIIFTVFLLALKFLIPNGYERWKHLAEAILVSIKRAARS